MLKEVTYEIESETKLQNSLIMNLEQTMAQVLLCAWAARLSRASGSGMLTLSRPRHWVGKGPSESDDEESGQSLQGWSGARSYHDPARFLDRLLPLPVGVVQVRVSAGAGTAQ
eukprot:scaffold582_cov385-Prasinococcus_capsulatus_cf.AAC.3